MVWLTSRYYPSLIENNPTCPPNPSMFSFFYGYNPSSHHIFICPQPNSFYFAFLAFHSLINTLDLFSFQNSLLLTKETDCYFFICSLFNHVITLPELSKSYFAPPENTLLLVYIDREFIILAAWCHCFSFIYEQISGSQKKHYSDLVSVSIAWGFNSISRSSEQIGIRPTFFLLF